MKWQGWIITSDWYDKMGSGHFCGNRTRVEAIKEFLESWPGGESWQSLKRRGWRCIKCTANW